ncbi:MAG: response regulator [Chloroflexota bacterium]
MIDAERARPLQGRHHVLLVEDVAVLRQLAVDGLARSSNWQVATAGSCEEALRLAAAEPWEVMLLDFLLPDGDAPTLLRALRAAPSSPLATVPVILMTAAPEGLDEALLAAWGIAGLITKPFRPLLLAAEVSSILGWES